jgi:hypothetical protein
VLQVVPWSQLQHITVERGIDISIAHSVMSSCTNATSELIKRECLYEFGLVADRDMDPITLPITSLGLQCDDVQIPSDGDYLVDWQWLLACNLPSLHVLNIHYGDYSRTAVMDGTASTFFVSYCHLKSLSLKNIGFA